MKFFKSILLIVLLCGTGFMKARVALRAPAVPQEVQTVQPAPKQPLVYKPQEEHDVAPPISIAREESEQIVQPKLSMEVYAKNKVAVLQHNLVDDIFPKKETIERIVNEFKDEYPGPNKSGDTAILYNAIMKNPEIRKILTLENAVGVYRFIQETISRAWDKQEEIIWSR